MPNGTLDRRASRLLDLMREADDEAVALDELRIVGVDDPAAALLALELAGYGLERVIDTTERGREVPCVRLAAAPPAPAATVSPLASPAARIALAGLLGLLLLALVRALRPR